MLSAVAISAKRSHVGKHVRPASAPALDVRHVARVPCNVKATFAAAPCVMVEAFVPQRLQRLTLQPYAARPAWYS